MQPLLGGSLSPPAADFPAFSSRAGRLKTQRTGKQSLRKGRNCPKALKKRSCDATARRAGKSPLGHGLSSPGRPQERDLLLARPRPLLGDTAGLEAQVLRGGFAAFWLDLLLFGRDKAAGESGGTSGARGWGGTCNCSIFTRGSRRCLISGKEPSRTLGHASARGAGLPMGVQTPAAAPSLHPPRAEAAGLSPPEDPKARSQLKAQR